MNNISMEEQEHKNTLGISSRGMGSVETLFLKPREYSDNHIRNTHNTRELTPIWDMVSTLYKLQRERELRQGKITNPTKGTSKYHR